MSSPDASGELERLRRRADRERRARVEAERIAERTTRRLYSAVSELEEQTQILLDSEERFRLLVDNIPGAVYRQCADAARSTLLVSDAITALTGHPPTEFAAGAVAYSDLVHEADRAALAAVLERAAAAGGAFSVEYRLLHRDGSERWVSDRGRITPRAAGAPLIDGVVFDVSELKHAEADRQRMESELRVAHKLEAVGQLAAGIAHEINTPIQFIGDSVVFVRDAFADVTDLLSQYRQALATVAEDDGATSERTRLAALEDDVDLAYLEERVPAAFVRTLDGVERVASIVRAMKEFAHTGQGEQAAADLNSAIESTLVVARNEYKYVARLETDYGTLAPVVCNLSDLNQVFLNLVVNAAHAIAEATPDGEFGTITVRTWQDGCDAVVAISDTGGGIPDEIRERVFDPFFTTKEVGRGSGQGLSLARTVVERHGGVIAFTSAPGAGTTFTVRIPIGGRAEELAA